MKSHKLSTAVRTVIATSMVTAGGLSLPSHAEESMLQLEEVVVTARKKDESIMDVPMNISTIGDLEIDKRNLITKEDWFRQVPGAAMPREELILRGLSGGNDSTPETTSSFVDGVPFDFSDLYDVERVEVLRGPQGTLWGSNAIGGTVQIITKKPSTEAFEIFGSAHISQEKSNDRTGNRVYIGVNIPMGDSVAARIVGSVSHIPGQIENVNTGKRAKQEDKWLRSQLLWDINDDAQLMVGYTYWEEWDEGAKYADPSAPGGHYTASLTANPDSPNNGYDVELGWKDCEGLSRIACRGGQELGSGTSSKYSIWESVDEWAEDKTNLITVNFTHANLFNIASMTYLGSWREKEDRSLDNWSRSDSDDLFKTWIINHDSDQDVPAGERVTHELRFQSINEDSPLDWTIGAFYDKQELGRTPDFQYQYHEGTPEKLAIATELWGYWGYIWDDENGNPQTINQLGESLYGDPTKNYNIGYYDLTVEETAFFGEISYTFDIGEHELELLAGIRFYDFEDSEAFTESGIWIGEEPGDDKTSGGSDGDTQKYSVSWRPNEDMSIYALYSEGYRPGGVSIPSLPQSCRNDPYAQFFNPRYESDTIENYELGFKALLLDRRLSITSAIYQVDWTDVQADIYMATCGFSFYGNGAEAQSQGFEWESTYLIQDDFTFIFSYGYTDSEMTADAPGIDAADGDDMTMVPKYNAYAALDKGFEIYGKEASVRLSVSAYDEFVSHFRTLDEDIVDSYERWDLSGSIAPSDNIRMSLHIDNLLDEEITTYKRSRLSNPDYGLEQYVYYAPERTVTLRVDFNY